jgi:hypothetical protein
MRDDREGAAAGDFSDGGHGKSVDPTGREPGGKALFYTLLFAWADYAQSWPNDAQQEMEARAILCQRCFRYLPWNSPT